MGRELADDLGPGRAFVQVLRGHVPTVVTPLPCRAVTRHLHTLTFFMQNVDTMDAGRASTGSGCNRQLLEVRWRLKNTFLTHVSRLLVLWSLLDPVVVPGGATSYTWIIVIQWHGRYAAAYEGSTVKGITRKRGLIRQARTATSAQRRRWAATIVVAVTAADSITTARKQVTFCIWGASVVPAACRLWQRKRRRDARRFHVDDGRGCVNRQRCGFTTDGTTAPTATATTNDVHGTTVTITATAATTASAVANVQRCVRADCVVRGWCSQCQPRSSRGRVASSRPQPARHCRHVCRCTGCGFCRERRHAGPSGAERWCQRCWRLPFRRLSRTSVLY